MVGGRSRCPDARPQRWLPPVAVGEEPGLHGRPGTGDPGPPGV